MKKKLLFMAGVIAVSLSISPAVWAEAVTEEAPAEALEESTEVAYEEEDLLDLLFGSEGIVAGILPGEADIEAMIDTVEEQVGTVESQTQEVIEVIKEELQNRYGSLNFEEMLEEYAGGLVSSILGSGEDIDFSDLDALIEQYQLARDQMKDCVLEMNRETLVPGDVQIAAITTANDPDLEAEEFKYLVEADQSNFEADGTVLRFVSGASFPVLFTFQKTEDGSSSIVDVRMPEDGEGFADSLKEMCAEVDYPFEEMLTTMDAGKSWILDEMATYLREHPEYEGIELDGEILTAEELEDLWLEQLSEIYAEGETEIEEVPEMEQTEMVEQ